MKFIDMKVTGVIVDSSSLVPMVILKDMDEKNVLPILIGIMEAASILTELENTEIDRPMTHDLIKEIIGSLGSSVKKVLLTTLEDNVFYASIHIVSPSGEAVEVDSRPSDAIALAMRCGVPISVNESIISKSRIVDLSLDTVKDKNSEELTSVLENLSEEDFGKYKM